MSRRAKWITNTIAVIAGTNFAAFWVVAVYLGGDALNGYIRGQHYFLCGHGECHEVARTLWRYSYWHTISALVGLLAVFVVAALLVNTGDIVLDFDSRA